MAEVCTNGPQETRELGHSLGLLLSAGMVVALHGDLGAGKTTLTQGIALGMGVTALVTSPTFTLVNEYDTRRGLRLIHVDSYRLGESALRAEDEAATFGFEEIVEAEDSVVVIEWAERLSALLPDDYLSITLFPIDNDEAARKICIEAYGPASAQLVARMLCNDKPAAIG